MQKVLIATPCYGRMLHQSYVASLVGTVEELIRSGIRFQTLFLGNESNIQRARNDLAHYALTSPENFTDLFFIDADMGWEPETVISLLRNDRDIIGGVCVKKKLPLEVVMKPIDGEDADAKGIVKVAHAPVAFMRIKLGPLRGIARRVPLYRGFSSISGKEEQIRNLFPSGPGPDGNFQSEDYGFTSLMRSLGKEIFLDINANTTHTGMHTYGFKD